MTQSDWDSAQLYAGCRSANSAEIRAAFSELWRYLFRVSYHVCRDQPDAEQLAQDCTQRALIRIHDRIDECREPDAFRIWARRIVSHLTIDELRKRKRLLPLDEPLTRTLTAPNSAETTHTLDLDMLQALLADAPISERSQRVVVGRYFDALPDAELAETESQLSNSAVSPANIQVTRAKNIRKLRHWEPIRAFFGKGSTAEQRLPDKSE